MMLKWLPVLRPHQWLSLVVLILVVGFAVLLRVPQLSQSEPKRGDALLYLNNARAYSQFIQQGQWSELINYRGSYEHPALVKLLYGFALAARDQIDLPVTQVVITRSFALLFSVLLVLLLTLINPFAGLFLALHSTHIRANS